MQEEAWGLVSVDVPTRRLQLGAQARGVDKSLHDPEFAAVIKAPGRLSAELELVVHRRGPRVGERVDD